MPSVNSRNSLSDVIGGIEKFINDGWIKLESQLAASPIASDNSAYSLLDKLLQTTGNSDCGSISGASDNCNVILNGGQLTIGNVTVNVADYQLRSPNCPQLSTQYIDTPTTVIPPPMIFCQDGTRYQLIETLYDILIDANYYASEIARSLAYAEYLLSGKAGTIGDGWTNLSNPHKLVTGPLQSAPDLRIAKIYPNSNSYEILSEPLPLIQAYQLYLDGNYPSPTGLPLGRQPINQYDYPNEYAAGDFGRNFVIPSGFNPCPPYIPPPPPNNQKNKCKCMGSCCDGNNGNLSALLKAILAQVSTLPTAIPDGWQIRPEWHRPQVIYQFAQINSGGTIVGPPAYPITVPHHLPTQPTSPLPNYQKGNWEIIYVLNDNSKVTIHSLDETNGMTMLNAIKARIDPDYLTGAYLSKSCMVVTETPLAQITVTNRLAKYWSQGAKNNLPDWIVKWPTTNS